MIYDSFIFYNEVDLLELRLKELWNVVDKFVIVEMPVTFSNRPKPYHFLENIHRFEPYLSKIQRVEAHGYPLGEDPWKRESWQRNAQAWIDLKPDDVITITDADEIPHPDVYRMFKERNLSSACLKQMFFHYWINLSKEPFWMKARICTGEFLNHNSPDALRAADWSEVIEPGGWHFSSFGDEAFIRNKAQSFSHHRDQAVHDFLADPDLNRQKDIDSGMMRKSVVDSRWPKEMLKNWEHWSKFQCDREARMA